MRRGSSIEEKHIPKDHERKKGYAHFDRRVSFDDVRKKVTDPTWVKHHGFYPFIRRLDTTRKYSKATKEVKTKERPITYASHIDRCIYQYYASQLNESYEERLRAMGLSECPIAYRRGSGKNNCHFAREVFDYIRSFEDCTILVVDFYKYFDCLDRHYLMERIKSLFEQRPITNDMYHVLKGVIYYA